MQLTTATLHDRPAWADSIPHRPPREHRRACQDSAEFSRPNVPVRWRIRRLFPRIVDPVLVTS